ncbi:MAG: hypothetical protein NZ522_00870, partial [Chitinophagales bacterium]|nr:hypothetical protein [Chitinophagales bacterium]
MGKKQIVVIAVAFVALILTYLFSPTKKNKTVKPLTESKENQKDTFDIQQYLKLAKENLKSKDTLALIEQQEQIFQKLSEATERTAKKQAAKVLSDLHGAAGDPIGSVYYLSKAAELSNDPELWHQAGEAFLLLATSVSAPATKNYLFKSSIKAFGNAASLEPESLIHKVKLGTAYVEEGANPMQGITILLEVVKKDSLHPEANFALGKFSMVSGQYEKAIGRFEKVLHSQPQNAEALFLLAESYRGMGNKIKA